MRKKDDYLKKTTQLIEVIGKVYPSNRKLAGKSFLQGVFFGLGTTLGVSIVLALLTFILNQLKLIPVLSQIVSRVQIEQYVPANKLNTQD
jgi:Na+-translocating ferredoxin:NAD+ oxidoreductase RnfA subunit